MALTVTLRNREVVGQKRRHTVDLAFDNSYPTGGEALTAANVGLASVDYMEFPENTSGYIFQYDRTNSKVIVYSGGGAGAHTHDILIKGGQAAATTNVLAHHATNILGKEAATDATIAGADSATKGGVMASTASVAAMSEVANTTDLSALTAVRAVAWGR